MKSIILYFQIHQPFRLKRYRFFDIGKDDSYYDYYLNKSIIERVSGNCYIPANELMLKLLKKYKGKFRISFSISGTALDQMQIYVPQVIKSFKKLAKTGYVEFLAETYSHSLASLVDNEEFEYQIERHSQKIQELFGQKPRTFRNTELVYSDEIGRRIYDAGYKMVVTEGAKHILGWKSPNYLYFNSKNPRLKLFLRNYTLSDDIAFRFKQLGITAETFTYKLLAEEGEIIVIGIDYETLGEHIKKEDGIFDFFEKLPEVILATKEFGFKTFTSALRGLQPSASFSAPNVVSWADEEKDITAWIGNEMQNEAFKKLYDLEKYTWVVDDEKLLEDWSYLQTSDHFYYMGTKLFNDAMVHKYFSHFDSPYKAFINYMNVLTDFSQRIKDAAKQNEYAILTTKEIKERIKYHENEIKKLNKQLMKKSIEKTKPVAKAIEKVKKQAKPIDKQKKEAIPIDKTKKEPPKLKK